MNLTEMRTLVRRDLKDEATPFRWSDAELDRHILYALKEFSEALPLEQKATIATTPGSREISLSTITDRIMLQAVEFPVDKFPRHYQRFAIWGDLLSLLGDEVPDGSDANIYYGKLHTLDATTSTIPPKHEDLVATGAGGYAAISASVYSTDRVSVGGTITPREFLAWGKARLRQFKEELKRLSRRNRLRVRSLYKPYYSPVSKSIDFGP